MDSVIGLLYEKETEVSEELKEIDAAFEKQLNCLMDELSKNGTGYDSEEVRDKIFAILMPMKKEIFVYGFKIGTQMLIEALTYNP